MSGIWVPEQKPPQVSTEAQETLSQLLLKDNVVSITDSLQETLLTKNWALGDYVMDLGIDMAFEHNTPLTKPIVTFGAAVALHAYQESGFDQIIDEEVVERGVLKAGAEGVPLTYLISSVQDPGLQAVIGISSKRPEMISLRPGVRTFLEIGAGCVRHYLQSALEAA